MIQDKQQAIEARLEAARQVCTRQGAQLTELRRRVLELVLLSARPATAYQLLDRLKATRKAAMPPTIYRALDFLVENQLVHKVERLNAFVPCIDAGQRHRATQFLICRSCCTVIEIEDRAVATALQAAAERQGFQPGHAIVEVDGTCAACRASS